MANGKVEEAKNVFRKIASCNGKMEVMKELENDIEEVESFS